MGFSSGVATTGSGSGGTPFDPTTILDDIDTINATVADLEDQLASPPLTTFLGSFDVVNPGSDAPGDLYINNGIGQMECVPVGVFTDPAQFASWLAATKTGLPLQFLTASIPNPVIGTAFLFALSASNGVQYVSNPYTWSVDAGTPLPAGLSLNPSTGIISGTATGSPGTVNCLFTVTDAALRSRSITLGITTQSSSTLTFTMPTIPQLQVGVPMTPIDLSQFTQGGTGGNAWSSIGLGGVSTLPNHGLKLVGSILSGTPTLSGTITVGATVTDNTAHTAVSQRTVVIASGAPPLVVATTSLPSATQNAAYPAQTLAASNGISPYSWAVTVGTLPVGLTLHPSTGVIDGTPTGTGTSNFTVTVTDSATPSAATATKDLSITVAAAGAALTFTIPALPAAAVGITYSRDIHAGASGGTGTYTFSAVSGLTNGLTISSAGVISGKPTASGTITPTIRCSDGVNHVDVATSITIQPSVPLHDISAFVSTDFDLATGVGTYASGPNAGKAVVPSAVAAAIKTAWVNASKDSGYVVNLGAAGMLPVGVAAGSSSWDSFLINASYDGFRLNGTYPGTAKAEITLAPKQPSPTPGGVCNAGIMVIQNCASVAAEVSINGNAKNQHTEASNNPNGCYYHGFRIQTCGAFTGYIVSRNVRCVTSLSGINLANPNTGTKGLVAETMAFQGLACYGADLGDVEVFCDDGSAVAGYASPDHASEAAGYPAEGAVSNYRKDNTTTYTWRIHNGHHVRQVVGMFCGGTPIFLIDPAGTYGTSDEWGNLETGYGSATKQRIATGNVVIKSLTPGVKFSLGQNKIDFRVNGNANQYTTGTGGTIDISDVDSETASVCVQLENAAWAKFTLHTTDVHTPGAAGLKFLNANSKTNWSPVTYLDTCRISAASAGKDVMVPVSGVLTRTTLVAGHGTFGTF